MRCRVRGRSAQASPPFPISWQLLQTGSWTGGEPHDLCWSWSREPILCTVGVACQISDKIKRLKTDLGPGRSCRTIYIGKLRRNSAYIQRNNSQTLLNSYGKGSRLNRLMDTALHWRNRITQTQSPVASDLTFGDHKMSK